MADTTKEEKQQEETADQAAIPETSTTKAEEPPKDEEGLLLSYDVIICGTGLVQSILASALTRAGKTVLHCDGNDHYGELDTVWTFEYMQELLRKQERSNEKHEAKSFSAAEAADEIRIPLAHQGSYQSLRFHSSHKQTNFPALEVGTTVQTPYGAGKIIQKNTPHSTENDKNAAGSGTISIALTNWTLANGKAPTVHIGVLNKQKDFSADDLSRQLQQQGIVSKRTILAQKILEQQSRSLALDVTPSLLYASGTAVNGFITSGVAEHLEFQTMQAVYWLQQEEQQSNNKMTSCKLERVPCSKGDVFQSPLLPPLDKRRFMKFFQLAMDYATERELLMEQQQQQHGGMTDVTATETTTTTDDHAAEEGVLSLNERQLNQGRSLARPQNKAVSQKDLQTLHDCMDKNMDFDTYLVDHAKLSPQLTQLIRHALALDIGGCSSSSSESTNGNGTGTLTTQEGMIRLCDHLKGLGRYGTTAFLFPLYGSGEMPQFFCRSAAVYGATYLLRRIPSQVILVKENDTTRVDGAIICAPDEDNVPLFPGQDAMPKEKKIRASHVVVAKDAMFPSSVQNDNIPATANERRLVRRISILRGDVVPNTERSVIVIPPRGVGNHKYAIHCILLDESVKVAPYGCHVLHLTTVVDEKDIATTSHDNAPEDLGCLEKALQDILESSSSSSTSSEPTADEIYHATFSYRLCNDETNHSNDIDGLYVIGRSPMSLVVDEAFDQAKRVFVEICGPNEEFLALSEQMQAKLKEQLQDAYRGPNQVDDDADQNVLDSAMEMLS
jgi:RAB protein geranylgeranyltransferase component A